MRRHGLVPPMKTALSILQNSLAIPLSAVSQMLDCVHSLAFKNGGVLHQRPKKKSSYVHFVNTEPFFLVIKK